MKTTTKLLMLLTSATFVVACGGASKTSNKGMSDLAKGAPPPPSGENRKLDRSVSKATENDFAGAVAYFKEQAKAGWNEASCQESANRFGAIVDASPKIIEARFNSGLSFQSCGMNKAAEDEYQKALKI